MACTHSTLHWWRATQSGGCGCLPALVLCTVCTWYVSLRAVFQVGGVRAVYQTWTLVCGMRRPSSRMHVVHMRGARRPPCTGSFGVRVIMA